MPGRTPSEAYTQFIDPIQRALNYIAVGRFSVGRNLGGLKVDAAVNSTLNNGDSVPIRSSILGPLFLAVGLRFRITRIDVGQNPFDCQLAGYWYSIFTSDDEEIVTFHWTPNASGPERACPHLHVGSVVSSQGGVLPDRFHKLHLPTERISVESFVRFGIEELGVEIRPGFNRQAVLRSLLT